MPYSLAACDHHVQGSLKPCPPEVPTPACVRTCRSGYEKTYANDKTHG
jgi:cathepsin B